LLELILTDAPLDNMVEVLIWSILEPSVAIISICLPSWFYFVRRWRQEGVTSLFSSQEHSVVNTANVLRGGPKNSFRQRMSNFMTLHSGGSHSKSSDAALESGSQSEESRMGVPGNYATARAGYER
jgi:hypothetical protein